MSVIELGDHNFRETYENNDIVVIDFWASWCGPCHQFAPIYKEVAEKTEGAIFGKVETEAEPKLSAYFGIRSIPTIVILRDKIEVFRNPGGIGPRELHSIIEKVKELDMDEVRQKMEEEENK